MRLTVHHETVYTFDPPMRGVVQSHRLSPSICRNQDVVSWQVSVEGASRGCRFRDGAGDATETISLLGPVARIVVHVDGEVETRDMNGVLTGHREKVAPQAYLRPTRATLPDRPVTELADVALAGLPEGDVLARAHALSNAVADAIAYTPGQTEHTTTAAEALALGHGVCQDHTHALIAAALASGIPARYVVGYLFASEDEGQHEASHAWAELFVPDLGWVGFDAANRCCPDERYIRLASGSDAMDAAPIRGIARGAGDEALDVKVIVNQAAQ